MRITHWSESRKTHNHVLLLIWDWVPLSSPLRTRRVTVESALFAAGVHPTTDEERNFLQRYLYCCVYVYQGDIVDKPLVRRLWLTCHRGQQCKIWCFIAVRIKNAVFWYIMTQCGSFKNRCFGWAYRLNLQGERIWDPFFAAGMHPTTEEEHSFLQRCLYCCVYMLPWRYSWQAVGSPIVISLP
jgi:hypothetical protein